MASYPSADMWPAPARGSSGASWPLAYFTHSCPVDFSSGTSYLPMLQVATMDVWAAV
jgi:hypothetical protein